MLPDNCALGKSVNIPYLLHMYQLMTGNSCDLLYESRNVNVG